jgi:hypothetical protein
MFIVWVMIKSKSELDKYVDLFVEHFQKNIFELFPKKMMLK